MTKMPQVRVGALERPEVRREPAHLERQLGGQDLSDLLAPAVEVLVREEEVEQRAPEMVR
jgi:hypothetical protein